jgi:hypothetical protein
MNESRFECPDCAVQYDVFVHPALVGQSPETIAFDREVDEKLAGMLLQHYLHEKARAKQQEPFRAKRQAKK